MENWKIATIAALLLALLGFGIVQQNGDKYAANPANAAPTGAPTSAIYVGKTPPAWNFKTWSGAPTSLASLRGKFALVEIFRIECPHCRDAAPFLVALQKRYGPRGFKIVSIQSPGNIAAADNPESSWKNVQDWIKEFGIKYPVAFDGGSKYFQGTVQKQILKGDASKLLYPTLWLVDPSGKIVFSQTGHDTERAIALALELERRFPTTPAASDSPRRNGADLAKWLTAQLPEIQADKVMSKALGDDLGLRLLRGN